MFKNNVFEYSEEICNKIKNANCLDAKDLQMVEIALKLYECHSEILNECLGLDITTKEENDYFKLKHSVHRNNLKNNKQDI